ncbi:MAG: nitroreductase family protein [Solirubrobacterales bacterium]|nr:nitroreductase family protein [Solirubrobacterales bacterium]
MDVFLAVASRREVREYLDRSLPESAVNRILEAGRVSGSSRNRQPWSFVVVDDPGVREGLADAVYVADNVRGASLVLAITVRGRGPVLFDAGRAAQNMMLVAWNEGIGSCPNGMGDPDGVARLLGLEEDERPVTVLTFGYPVRPRDPARRSPEDWIARADRKPLEAVVRQLG